MQPRIPRQTAGDSTVPGLDNDAGLSAELAAVVTAARRRAFRDGDRHIDTAHLLHSLLEYDSEAYAALDDGGPRIARLLGYLVQRSIGYGLRWQDGVEDSGGLPVTTTAEGFSPLAAVAMEQARARAARRSGTRARGLDLLATIVEDPQARAVEVLARAGIDTSDLLPRIERGLEEYAAGGEAGH
ncbi:Clp protease N-terminal domain-containing protein [Streptomyces sp. HUAS ZL42]|uniref:Clp protease N-terminal domain-containing protein n=1 Tax=Streptomyces sp. HUAS ZL42 TaxID=3231715 RepID=UPI00345E63FA